MSIFTTVTMEPARRDLPLDALAARIGDELGTLALLCAEVQSAISMCAFAEHTDPEAVRGLQGIDRITQALEDLCALMDAVSSEMPRDVFLHAVPILSRLRLHELVQNLDPTAPKTVKPVNKPDGDIDWF